MQVQKDAKKTYDILKQLNYSGCKLQCDGFVLPQIGIQNFRDLKWNPLGQNPQEK